MSYTQVFGGTTIYPSDVSYLAITLDADKALEWPLESNDPSNPAARVIDVTASGSHSIILPSATQTGAGQTILFNNLSASTHSFLLKDYAGNTIATIGIGEQWQVYLADTATAAGVWRIFRYGASTATVQASALAGYGIAVTDNTLSQSTPVTTFNSGPRTVLLTDRASMLVWEGTGAGTVNLPSTVTAGNNFFISFHNNGGGDLTLDAAGSETIDGLPTLAMRPGDSLTLVTDGLMWFSLGLGQQAVFAFDYTSISVTGGTYTLAGPELNRIAYKFVGVLGSDQYVVVPSTIQQYWVDNATTGPYQLYLQTSGGTPINVTQGGRGIYYCNGSNVIDADTSTVPLPISASNGGTGITSYSIGDLLVANASTTLTKLSDVATGNVLLSGGVGVAPLYGKVGLATHVTGTLPVANGGTGVTTSTGTGSTVLSISPTLVSPTLVTPLLGTPASGTLTNCTDLPLTTGVTGTLPVANGGTGITSFGAGVATFLGTPSSANLAAAVTDETGSGALVFATSPTLVTPALGTPSSGTLTNCTGLPLSGTSGTLAADRGGTGQTSYAVGDLIYASGATALSKLADVATGSVLLSGGVGAAPAYGKVGLTTHVSGTLPVANGGTGITSLGTGVATFLGTPSSANLAAAVTDETGSGALVFATSPTLVTPALGTPTSGTLSNCSGLPIANTTGTLAVGKGGTGQTTYTDGQLLIGNTSGGTLAKATLTAGTGMTITNGAGSITLAPKLVGDEASSNIVVGSTNVLPSSGGLQNTALGVNAGNSITSGDGNTVVGYNAGTAILSASGNTLIGSAAGPSVTSDSNTAVGSSSGYSLSTGAINTFLGINSGILVTTGSRNTLIGPYRGSTTLTSNVVLSDGDGNRRFWHDGTDAFVSHTTTASAANARLDSTTSALQRSTSSARYKRDIEDMAPGFADAVLGLRPVWYRSKCEADPADWGYWGFIAEEAAEVDPRLVQWAYLPEDLERDEADNPVPKPGAKQVPDGFAYERLTVHLLALAKKQRDQIEALEARLTALEAR